MKNETAGPGKYIEYSYRLYDEATGELLFETPEGQPDFMVFGVSHEIVPGLVHAIEGLSAGDRFETTLPPAAAFGESNPEYVMELDADIFMRDGEMADEVKPGAVLPMMTAEGYRVVGTVLSVGDKVKMDFNHPFAGKTVTYKGLVETVREATPEELHPAKGGCGGCGGGCCSGSGSEGCGSDCGSSSEGCCCK